MKIIFFANTEWYLFNFRLGLAKFLRDRGHEVIMMSPEGEYGQKLIDEGFRWYSLKMDRKSMNVFREAKVLRDIGSILKKEKPDIIHNFTIKCVLYGSIVGRIVGIQSRVNAVAGLGYIFTNNSAHAILLRPIVKFLLRLSLSGKQAQLILQNPDDQDLFLKSNLVEKNKIKLIKGSGVNTTKFHPTEGNNIKPFRVLLAARLLWEKGIKEYIEAVRLLTQKRPNELEFLLVGSSDEGNPSAVPQASINRWVTEGLMIAPGHVEDMVKLMATVNLVVLPSFYGEGVPRSLIEAAAMGLPIITTDAPGCREIVSDGVNGYLVPVRDHQILAKKMEYLLDHPEVCGQFGKAGRKKVLDEFDERIVFEKTYGVYEKVLGMNGS